MKIKEYHCALVLPQLDVQNANAISGPMTWGFPAMSAFAGFTHALQRKVRQDGFDVYFDGVAVVCHSAEPQIASDNPYRPRTFCLTRNPLMATGGTAAIVEEGRMHLTVSLVLTVSGPDAPVQTSADAETVESANPSQPAVQNSTLADIVMQHALTMRLAGGNIIPPHSSQRRKKAPCIFLWGATSKVKVQRRLMRYVMPGFVLVSQTALLGAHLATMRETIAATTPLDALLDLCALHSTPINDTIEEGKVEWVTRRRRPATGNGKGWLVPIPVGFAAISEVYPPGMAKQTRDPSVPFCFVESVLGLGSWQSPHRCEDLEDTLWRFDAQPEKGTYLISNIQAE